MLFCNCAGDVTFGNITSKRNIVIYISYEANRF